jgi:hypothetical protein
VATVLQTSVGEFILRVDVGGGLALQADLLAALAVVVALRMRSGLDAVLSGWVLGLAIDLTSYNSPLGLYAGGFDPEARTSWRSTDRYIIV